MVVPLCTPGCSAAADARRARVWPIFEYRANSTVGADRMTLVRCLPNFSLAASHCSFAASM